MPADGYECIVTNILISDINMWKMVQLSQFSDTELPLEAGTCGELLGKMAVFQQECSGSGQT
jgi:hypothetical protein